MTPPLLHVDDTIETAVGRLVESQLSALPVVDQRERFVGVFGEREFMSALFPGYLGQLSSGARPFCATRSTTRWKSARRAAMSASRST